MGTMQMQRNLRSTLLATQIGLQKERDAIEYPKFQDID